jgi:hypothetical protein
VPVSDRFPAEQFKQKEKEESNINKYKKRIY